MLAMWFLGAAIITLVSVLLYAAYVEDRRNQDVAADLKNIRSNVAKLLAESHQHESKIQEHTHRLMDHVDKTQGALKAISQSSEILDVRQRSLEKKIISNERTVNLVFRGNVPVEQIPHTVTTHKQTRGRGKGALIPETT